MRSNYETTSFINFYIFGLMSQRLTKKELWSENIGYYRSLISQHKFDQAPMLDLFPLLEECGFFEKYYPSNSHEALGISMEEFYAERLKKPMVYISYLPAKAEFVVYYQKGQGKTMLEEFCGSAISAEIFLKIDQWLSKVKIAD